MNILAVESSCDETAVAIVRDGREVLCDCIASQVDLHKIYGGVVPEIASRKHTEAIVGVFEETLARAGEHFGVDAVLEQTCFQRLADRGSSLGSLLSSSAQKLLGVVYQLVEVLLVVVDFFGNFACFELESRSYRKTRPPGR